MFLVVFTLYILRKKPDFFVSDFIHRLIIK